MMVTDPQRQRRSDPGRPEVCNVFSLHNVFTPQETVQQIDADCRTAAIGCVDCKKLLAKNLADYLAPFRERRAQLASDPDYVWGALHEGAERANVIASEVIAEVKASVGLP
jgi:tryptophanyl-tRNA synthetase